MSISIGTSTPSTVRETHAAWLRRREDGRPNPWRFEERERDQDSSRAER